MKDVPKAIEAVWKIEFTRLIAAIARVTHDIGTKAATGSAHDTRQIALAASPANAITERQAHNADSAASALRAALPVDADRRRFSFASLGMIAAATIRTAIPRSVGLGSLYPSRAIAEAVTT